MPLGKWIEQYLSTPLNCIWFNKIIAETWHTFISVCTQVIIDNFRKTKLYPLAEPDVIDMSTIGASSIASMQVTRGKLANE